MHHWSVWGDANKKPIPRNCPVMHCRRRYSQSSSPTSEWRICKINERTNQTGFWTDIYVIIIEFPAANSLTRAKFLIWISFLCRLGFYSDLVNWVLEEYGENGKVSQGSRLSRIHFHCLYVHILAVKVDHWRSNEASVSVGAWTAYSQACEADDANSDMAELKIPREFSESLSSPKMIIYNASDPISTVSRGPINIFISPVLVCRRPLKTVGLGDAISASGLLYNSFVP